MTIKFKWETEFKQTEIGEVLGGNTYYVIAKGVKGLIPRDWNIKKINEDFNVGTGKRVSPKNEGMYPVYGANGFLGFSDKFLVTGEAIITGRVGTLGEVFYVNCKADVSDNAFFITAKDKNTVVKFLYYSLKYVFKHVEEVLNVGISQPLIKQSELKIFSIPYPPLPEQSCIATVLSWFDDLIENKKRQNEILEKTAMAIFKSWFVDFESFRDGEFVYSEELGKEIPKGWEVRKLGEAISTQYGFTASAEEIGEIKLLRIMDINKNFVIDWDSVPFCNVIDKAYMKYQLRDKDIVISRIGDIGKIGIIEDPPASVFASYLIRLEIRDDKLPPYYLYYWLKGPDYQEYIQGAAEGSTRPNTNAEVIKAGPILISPNDIIDKFENMALSIRQKIIHNQKQIMLLRKTRDVLLPKLIFGKLRVVET